MHEPTPNAATIARDAIHALLDDPAGMLRVGSAGLFLGVAPKSVDDAIREKLGSRPSVLAKSIRDLVNFQKTTVEDTLTGNIEFQSKLWDWEKRRRHITEAFSRYALSRPVMALTDQEREILRGFAGMYAEGAFSDAAWDRFIALMTWGGGAGLFEAPDDLARHRYAPLARTAFRDITAQLLPNHRQFLEECVARMAAQGGVRTASLSKGARWLAAADLPQSRIYTTRPSPAALLLGYAHGQPLYFTGNESLFTIAPPGTGKTQGQVIPNLLTYQGSAFVLDVKGELYAATAKAREAFGPVHRFAPTDPGGHTARYNPFDQIADEPSRAALGCQVLAEQLLPDVDSVGDKYWDRRAKDMIWAMAMLVACTKGVPRTLDRLLQTLSFRTHFDDKMTDFLTSDTAELLYRMHQMGADHDIPNLVSMAQSIRNGLKDNERLESIVDVARSVLSIFGGAKEVRRSMAASDWDPLSLRTTPGTTVYICLAPGDLRAFAPVVRVMLQQHINALTRTFTAVPGVPPVTFFLDEMPQLGPLASISDAIDVGRGAGVRLWMFAQFLGQIRSAYGTRADGLVNSCRVRCFMQPDNDAAAFLAPALGRTRNMFSGEEQDLVQPHELMGRAYADRMIAVVRGELPALLDLRMAYRR